MSRSAFIKTALAAFLAGIAVTVVGIKVWISQPEQTMLRAMLEYRPVLPMKRSSVAPTIWGETDHPDFHRHLVPTPQIDIVPYVPALSLSGKDIAEVCVNYDEGFMLSVQITPSVEAARKMQALAQDRIGEDGISPLFTVHTDPITVESLWSSSKASLLEEKEYAARFKWAEHEDRRQSDYSINLNFPESQIYYGLRRLGYWGEEHAPYKECYGDTLPASSPLRALADYQYSKGHGARLFGEPPAN